jgi:hypothetical protein
MKYKIVFHARNKCSLWSAEGRFVRKPDRASREWFPVIRETGRIVRATGPTVREAGRVIRETFPVTRESGPTVREVGRVIRDLVPVIREAGRIVRESGPVVRDCGRIVRDLGPVVREVGRIVREAVSGQKETVWRFREAEKACFRPNSMQRRQGAEFWHKFHEWARIQTPALQGRKIIAQGNALGFAPT